MTNWISKHLEGRNRRRLVVRRKVTCIDERRLKLGFSQHNPSICGASTEKSRWPTCDVRCLEGESNVLGMREVSKIARFEATCQKSALACNPEGCLPEWMMFVWSHARTPRFSDLSFVGNYVLLATWQHQATRLLEFLVLHCLLSFSSRVLSTGLDEARKYAESCTQS